MLKVLHFFKTYYPDTKGGVEQVIYQISEGVRKHDIESDVLFLSRRGSASSEVLGSHQTHRSRLLCELASTGFSLDVLWRFRTLANQADVIHYHFPWPFMDLVHFVTKTEKPTLVSYHSDIVKQKHLLNLYRPMMHRFLHSMDSIVAACPNYVDSSEELGTFKSKVTVIPYGLEESTYPEVSIESITKWRERLGQGFFLFIGALRYYKGLHYLLEAAKLTGLPVVIVGQGGIEEELKVTASKLNLNNVHFTGGVEDEDKVALLQLCSAFVFPSHLRSEAFGISLLEAAMYGKPMISCEIGTGTTFVNIADETGLVVPPADSGALAAAMSRLWGDQEMRLKMGMNSRKRFERHFTAAKMSSSYANLYKKLVNRRVR